jgi:phosphatidylinositol alpha-1,6-mannosyltransferase
MEQASRLFAISEYTANLMRAQCNQPVTVIPLGADTNQFDPDHKDTLTAKTIRERYDIDGTPILLSVGRLNPRKGHDVTLRALPKIKREHPNVQIVIIGRSMEGEEVYEAELYSFIERMNLTENVRIISIVSSDELKAFYKLADVFILSSRNYRGNVEGFGIVLIEANLMRTPVVASRSGGIVDAVEDGKSGFLYQCEDFEDLAHKVLRLLDNESLRSEMGSYGRERALKDFNWQVVASITWDAIVSQLPETRF